MLSAIIPAAGRGTRMNSITRGSPKELLPVNGKPLILHTIQQAIDTGIRSLYIVISGIKQEIFEYLNKTAVVSVDGQETEFCRLKECDIQFTFLEQKDPLGLAHAYSLAEPYIGSEDFLALMPDYYYPDQPSPCTQLVNNYHKGLSCLGIFKLKSEQAYLFNHSGIVTYEASVGKMVKIVSISEKKKGNFPTNFQDRLYRSAGIALYSHDFFDIYRNISYATGAEKDDPPVVQTMIKNGILEGYFIKGRCFDTGNPYGYDAAYSLHQ